MVDTGAQRSIVSAKFISKFKLWDKVRKSDVVLKGIGNKKLKNMGTVELPISFPHNKFSCNFEFFVLDLDQSVVLFGTDFCQKEKIDILYSQMCMRGPYLFTPMFIKAFQPHVATLAKNRNTFFYNVRRHCLVIDTISRGGKAPRFTYMNSKGEMSCKRNYPKIKASQNKNHQSIFVESHIFLAQNNITIPANTELVVSVSLSEKLFRKLQGKEVYFCPTSKDRSSPVFMAHNLVTINSRRVPLLFANLSDFSFVIKKYTKMGYFHPTENNIDILPYSQDYVNRAFSVLSASIDKVKSETGKEERLSESECEKLKKEIKEIKLSEPWMDEIEIGEGLTILQEWKIIKLLKKYSGIFSKNRYDIGRTHLLTADLNVKTETPIFTRQYPLEEKKKEILKEEIETMEKMGLIEQSNSAFNSPLVLIKKKDGTFRVVTDFRKINKSIPPQNFPLPSFEETIEILANNKWYSNLDLINAYSQVPLAPDSKKYTGFTANNRKWVFRTLPFGLKNNVHIFQQMMSLLLGDMQNTRALCYVDDLCIFAKTFDSHLARLEELFQKLQYAKLKLKPSKCNLFQEKINFLGHEISREGIIPGQKKIEAVKNIPKPVTKKQVRQFLGLASYFRRFVPDFAELSAPLHDLTKPSTRFKWTEVENHSFNELKSRLCNPPVLAFPDPNKTYILTTDASTYGLGAILSQKTDGQEKVIAYLSRKLSTAELNYGATDLEMLAVCYAIEQFRPYLIGRHFILVTDHRPLLYLQQMKNPNSRHFRWILKLQDYSFSIQHRAGLLHGSVDMLSRNPQFKDSIERFKNDHVNLLKNLLIKPEIVEDWKKGVCGELSLNFNHEMTPKSIDYIDFNNDSLFQQFSQILTNDFGDFQKIRDIVHNMILKNKKFIQKFELFEGEMSEHLKGIKSDGPGGLLEINMMASILKIPIVLKYAGKVDNDEEDKWGNFTLESVSGYRDSDDRDKSNRQGESDSKNDRDFIGSDVGGTTSGENKPQNNVSIEHFEERERIIFGSLESPLKHFPPLGCVIVLKQDAMGNWIWQNFDLTMPKANFKPSSERSKNDKNARRKDREAGDTILVCSLPHKKTGSRETVSFQNRQEQMIEAQKSLAGKFSDVSHVRINAVRRENQPFIKDLYVPSSAEVKACQERDEFCLQWITFLKDNTQPKVTKLYFETHKECFRLNSDGLLTYKPAKNQRRGEPARELLVLPLNMFKFLMEATHVYMSHIGRDKTMALAAQRYYRPGLKRLITKYVASCALCVNKKGSRKAKAEVQYIPPASDRLSEWSLDVVGPLPWSKRRNRYIITMIDHFSRWVEMAPVSNIRAETVAEKIMIHIIARFGVPDRLHTDNAQNFNSKIIKAICKQLKIKKTYTSPYNPSSNGILESYHRFLGNALRLTVEQFQKTWDERIPHVLLAYRTTIHSALQDSPSFVLYGRDLRLPTEMLPPNNQNPDDLDPHHKGSEIAIKFMEARDIYRKVMEKETTRSRDKQNRSRITTQFNIGDIVLMQKPLTKVGLAQKLHRPYVGDFRIIKKIGKVNYVIQELNGTKTHIVHVNRIIKKHVDFLEQTEHWAEVAKEIFDSSNEGEVNLNTLWKEEELCYPVSIEAFTTRNYN